MTSFDDIRPFHDEEVQETIKGLLGDPEFITAITAFKFSNWPKWLRKLAQPLIKIALDRELSGVTTVGQVQNICSKYLDEVIEKTISKITISGLDNLKPGQAYLFISNHRDIVMDPAFVNYALYHNGFETARIAIGDNLLQKPFVSDLMRLNKSFIVKRSASGVREKMNAYTGLSRYIHHSIQTGCPIWIAQREGRAKNGIDKTDPAIIKMLYMGQKKGELSFSDYINWLNIVPVVICYEYNPCDRLIANELYQVKQHGHYQKTPGEDMTSIVTGITGDKGHVHVAFGKVLSGVFPDADSVADEIDRQIIANTVLHTSNYIAAQQLDATLNLDPAQLPEDKKAAFLARLAQCDDTLKPFFLALYANTFLRKTNY